MNIAGNGSGLPPNIVERLMAAERAPLKNMELTKKFKESRLNLINDLETKVKGIHLSVGEIGNRSGYKDLVLKSSDQDTVTGVPTSGVTPTGSWDIEVERLPENAASITNGFPDMDKTKAGVGYIRFVSKDEGEKLIYVSEEGSTLSKIAQTINQSGMDVKASIVNDRDDLQNPYRLIVSGRLMGSENNLGFPNLYFLDGEHDLFFDRKREAQNGIILVDGFEVGIAENVINDLIPGVSLEINKAKPGERIRLNVTENYEQIEGKLDGFVKSVNTILSFIQAQNNLNKDSDTRGTLGGDSILSSVQSRLHRIIQDRVVGTGSSIKRLHELGVEFNRSGTVDFKSEKFQNKMKTNPEDVLKFIVGDGIKTGFFKKLKDSMQFFVTPDVGMLQNRKRSIQNNIKGIDRSITSREKRLVVREKMLKDKFGKLEETLAKIKNQGASLSAIGAG